MEDAGEDYDCRGDDDFESPIAAMVSSSMVAQSRCTNVGDREEMVGSLLKFLKVRLVDKFEVKFAGLLCRPGLAERRVDYLIRLPMLLSRLEPLNAVVGDWLRLSTYYSAIFSSILPLLPGPSIRRFLFFNLAGVVVDKILDANVTLPPSVLPHVASYKIVRLLLDHQPSSRRTVLLSEGRLPPIECRRLLVDEDLTPEQTYDLLTTSCKAPYDEAYLLEVTKLLSQLWCAASGSSSSLTAALCQCVMLLESSLPEGVLSDCVVGVSLRLGESHSRLDGMKLAKCLSNKLGKDIPFEDLDGWKVYMGQPLDDTTHDYSSNRKGNNVITYDGDGESDSDCESDVSSDFSDDESDLSPVPAPIYLKELIGLLRCGSNDSLCMTKHKAGLEHAARLVRGKPPDLRVASRALARELLHMSNEYDIQFFEELRREALIALCVEDPENTVDYFCKDIFDGMGMGTRYEVLDCMINAAQEMAGISDDLLDGCKGGEKVKKLLPSDRREGKRSLVKKSQGPEPANNFEPKTRRWGKGRRRLKDTQTFVNNFGRHTSHFYFSLKAALEASRDRDEVWTAAGSDALIAKVLQTLCAIVESGVYQPGTDLLAADLFKLAWSFHAAKSVDVRRSALLCVHTGAVHIRGDVFLLILEEFDGALEPWLEHIASEDADLQSRQIATAVKDVLRHVYVSLLGTG